MSGPPYPPSPNIKPGANKIGSYSVQIHQIGTIPQFNWWDTVISQYANSPILTTIIGDCSAWIDQTQNFDSFYSNIWNIDTAIGYGLDVWGRIINITRNIAVDTGIWYFSFDIPELGFDSSAPIFVDGMPLIATNTVALTDADFRNLLYAKAATNISEGGASDISGMYNGFFSHYREIIFLTDLNQARQMNYTVVQAGETISPTNLAILSKNYLPIGPAGLAYDVQVASERGPIFGFDVDNSYVGGFDHSVFAMTPLQYLTTYGYDNHAYPR